MTQRNRSLGMVLAACSLFVAGQAGSSPATFGLDLETLTIVSGHGTATPVAGIYANLNGTVLTNSVTPVDTQSGAQYVAAGWTLVTTDVVTNTTLLTESFENEGAIPAGWETEAIVGGDILAFPAATTKPCGLGPYDGTRLVQFNSYNSDDNVNRLKRTTPVSTINCSNVTVDFAWLECKGYLDVPDHVEVEWSTDGSTWNSAGTFNRYNAVQGWKIKSCVLPAGANEQPELYVAFKFTSAWGTDCYLDLAHVTAFNRLVGAGSGTTMVMTNTSHEVLTWLWNTNYLLAATAGTGGSVRGSANDWHPSGSAVTVTAVAEVGYHFTGWSGDTNGCTLADNGLSGLMDQARSVTATFALDPETLTIVSAHGTATPEVGVYTNLYNTEVTPSVTGADLPGGTQYVVTGWSMIGNAPASGATAGFTMSHTNHAVLTWLWQTNYCLTLLPAAQGSITNATAGFKAAGSSCNLYPASADPALYGFSYWIVDGVSAGATVPLPVTMGQAHSVEAVFEPLFINVSSFADVKFAWTTNRLRGTINAVVTISNRQSSARAMLAPVWYEIATNRVTRLRYPSGTDANTGMQYKDVSTDFAARVSLIGNRDAILNPGEVVTLSPIEIWGLAAPSGTVMATWANSLQSVPQVVPARAAITGSNRFSTAGKSLASDGSGGALKASK